MKAVDLYYEKHDEPNKSILLAARHIILDFNPGFTETLKWSIPCFLYNSKICCYLNIEKQTDQPYILWANGDKLTNALLETKSRKKMKSLTLDVSKDLPIDLIQAILKEATKVL